MSVVNSSYLCYTIRIELGFAMNQNYFLLPHHIHIHIGMRQCWFSLAVKSTDLTSITGDPHVAVPNNNNIPDSIQRLIREQKKVFDRKMHEINRQYFENLERRDVSETARFQVCEYSFN